MSWKCAINININNWGFLRDPWEVQLAGSRTRLEMGKKKKNKTKAGVLFFSEIWR